MPVLPDIPITSSMTSGVMIVAIPLLVFWGNSLYNRCSDLKIRHYLLAIVVLCIVWLVEVLAKYISRNDILSSMLWYFYYVSILVIPLLCLFIALRMAFPEASKVPRYIKAACTAVTAFLVLLVLTNNFHHQVFMFDFSNPLWEDEYKYRWGYFAVYAWTIALFTAFFGILIAVSHLRLRRLFLPAVLMITLAAVYGALYALRVGNVFAGNFTLTFVLMLVVCLELLFRLGLLPSFSRYREVFDDLPFDTKVLSNDLKVVFQTRNSLPLDSGEKIALRGFVTSDAVSIQFKTPERPDYAYKALKSNGAIVLFAENRLAVNAKRRELEGSLEALKAQIAFLENSVSVQTKLYRLESERALLDEIDAHLNATVDTIRKLLDSIQDLPDGVYKEERRRTLVFVRLLIGYCKRMGGFVLADAEKDVFDSDRLSLAMSDTAADARASGIMCAAFVSVSCVVSKRSLMLMYNCMYDILIIAFQYTDATVMFNVRSKNEGAIEFIAMMEVEGEKDFAGSEVTEQLREFLSSYEIPYELGVDDDTLRLAIVVPTAEAKTRGERSAKVQEDVNVPRGDDGA